MNEAWSEDFLVGDFLVQPSLNRLLRGEEEIKVEPLVLEILQYLANRSGSVISRDELRRQCWPETYVTDNNMNRAIWKLRKALGDDPKSPQMVQTVPKRGYRLIAPVRPPGSLPGRRPKRLTLMIYGFLVLLMGVAGLWWGHRPVASSKTGDTPKLSRIDPLTTLRGYESGPAFAPDKEHLVFAHFAYQGSRPFQWDLFGKAGGLSPRRLTDHEGHEFAPAFAADGRLAYMLQPQASSAPCVILIRALNGSERRWRETKICFENRLAWSPEGELVFSDRPANGPMQLWRGDPNQDEVVALTQPPAQYLGDIPGSFTPDGRSLAFIRARAEDVADIYLLDLTTLEERRVTHHNQRIQGLCFRQDGRLIYGSNQTGTFALWEVSLSGGPATRLPTVGRNAGSPASTPGGALAYEEWKSTLNIMAVPLSGQNDERLRLATSSRWDWRPALAPGQRHLAFLSNREGSMEVWLADSKGNNPRPITKFGIQFGTRLRWHPDSKALCFAAPVHGDFNIYLYSIETERLEILTSGEADERTPCFAPDGQSVFFAANEGGTWQIMRMDLTSRALEQVTANGGFAPSISADGHWLYYSKHGEAGLLRMPLNRASTEELLIPDFPASQWMNWWLVHEGIYFLERDHQFNHFLMFRDHQGRISRRRQFKTEVMEASGLSISADGRQVLVTAVDLSDSDLWIMSPGENSEDEP